MDGPPEVRNQPDEQEPSAAAPRTAKDVELERLLDGVALADAELAQQAARLHRVVVSARIKGATWGQIGAALGVTPQAAQQRFTEKARAANRERSAQRRR